MIPLTNMLSALFYIHFQWCKLTVLHCTALHCAHLRNGFQLPLNDSSVQSIYTNTKHCCDQPGLRWRYVRQGLCGGKVGSILCSNWPPVQTRWSDLAFSGLLTLFLRRKKKSSYYHVISFYFILFWPSLFYQHGWIMASFIFWPISSYLDPTIDQ